MNVKQFPGGKSDSQGQLRARVRDKHVHGVGAADSSHGGRHKQGWIRADTQTAG